MVSYPVHEKSLSMSSINIHEPLEVALSLLNLENKKNMHLLRDYDPSIPLMKGDKNSLIQAFLNIGKNALQAIGQDGTIKVSTRVDYGNKTNHTQRKQVICVCFEDNGPGIDPKIIAEIFMPYVSGSLQGVGIGLSITEQIVSAHQGSIWVDSQPGSTVFSIIFPVV